MRVQEYKFIRQRNRSKSRKWYIASTHKKFGICPQGITHDVAIEEVVGIGTIWLDSQFSKITEMVL